MQPFLSIIREGGKKRDIKENKNFAVQFAA